jgi:hypothetical protein
MKMEQTECSETLAYKIQMPGNYPEESIQHLQHGKSLKSSEVSLLTGVCYKSGLYIYFDFKIKIEDYNYKIKM